MTVTLHRCRSQWAKLGGHPCWKVEKALIDAGVPYEVVHGPILRSNRDALEQLSGQRLYPVIELEDGTIWRDQSKAMAAEIHAGRLSAETTEPALD